LFNLGNASSREKFSTYPHEEFTSYGLDAATAGPLNTSDVRDQFGNLSGQGVVQNTAYGNRVVERVPRPDEGQEDSFGSRGYEEGRSFGNNINSGKFTFQQQQPQQVQTGEPMDLAFRLLKYTRPGRRDRNKDALEAHNQQIDRERKNLGLPRLTEAQRQKMLDENLLGSEVVRLNRAPKIETDERVPVNVRSAMQEIRRKEMHEKKQDRLEATARKENKVHTRVPYESRTSDRGSGVNMANAASADEYNIKPAFDPDTANYKKPTTDKINYQDEMKPTNPKSTGEEAGIAMEVHDEARLAEENNAKNWQKLDAETTRGLSDYLSGKSPAGKDRVTRETQEERNRQTKLNDMALEFAENRAPKGLQNTHNANVKLGQRGGYDPNFSYFNSTTDLSNIEGKEGRQQGEATARRIEAAQQAAQAKQIADEIQRRNAASQNNIQENNTGNGEL